VLAVHADRAGDAERHVHGANEVLDVAQHLLRRERHLVDRLERVAGVVRQPGPSHRGVGAEQLTRAGAGRRALLGHPAPAFQVERRGRMPRRSDDSTGDGAARP
jgi:hypothetical protein